LRAPALPLAYNYYISLETRAHPPSQVVVVPGESALAFYTARNTGKEAVTGSWVVAVHALQY